MLLCLVLKLAADQSCCCGAANYNVAADNQYSQTDILGTTIALLDKTGNGTVWDTFNNVSFLTSEPFLSAFLTD